MNSISLRISGELSSLLAGTDLVIWGTGAPLRQFIYSEDLARLTVSTCTHNPPEHRYVRTHRLHLLYSCLYILHIALVLVRRVPSVWPIRFGSWGSTILQSPLYCPSAKRTRSPLLMWRNTWQVCSLEEFRFFPSPWFATLQLLRRNLVFADLRSTRGHELPGQRSLR